MSQKLRSELILQFRKLLYLIYLLSLILSLCALYLAGTTGNHNKYGWWLLAVWVLFVGIDQLFGKEVPNPSRDQVKQHEKAIYYSFLLILCLPAAILLSFRGAYFFSNTRELNLIGRIGWIVSLGMSISTLTLSAGHELIHRTTRPERLIGGILFAFVCNAAFKTEHIRGHHVHVATPADIGTSNLNQSFYHFLSQAFKNTFVNAWLFEKKRLNRRGNSVLSWRNELITWHLISLGFAAIYYFFFGFLGLIFFIGQGVIALIIHHIINYIQHYGLKRRKLNDGRYEKFSPVHAWSCNFLISNMVSFRFPYHVDHHLNPRRYYQALRHIEKGPQMPLGYFGMFFMALIPPLWFKVMNPRVFAYNKETKYQKQIDSNFEKIDQPTSAHL